MRKYVILSAALLLSAGISAQELHESLRVEGTYIPDVIRQDKIRLLPQRLSPTADLIPMDYEQKGTVAAYQPGMAALADPGWATRRRLPDTRGYLDLGIGSFLDITGSAGYRFLDTSNSTAGFMLQHNSTSLFKARNGGNSNDHNRYRYDETLGFYGSHVFDGKGRLSAEAYYHLGLFNYYGVKPLENDPSAPSSFPSQTLNDIYAGVAWSSPSARENFRWSASAFYRYFGYRAFYAPGEDPFKGRRENNIGLRASAIMPWGSGSNIGGDLSFDFLGYNNPSVLEKLDSYGSLSLTPYYRFSRGDVNIRLGARLDFTFNAGPEGDRYNAFHAAPSVTLDWRQGIVGLYLTAKGGTELQTLSSLYQLDYYQNPDLGSTLPVYTPLDATLGVNIGPAGGFTAGVHVSYKYSDHTPLGGWYTAFLSPGYDALPQGSGYVYNLLDRGRGMRVSGISLGADIEGRPMDMLSFKASANYQPQNARKGYFNGFDRPRWTADISAEVKPLESLAITLGYAYRGVRTVYTRGVASLPVPTVVNPESVITGVRLPDITDLYLGASYDFSPRFHIWGEARNLLGRKVCYLPLQREEGFNFQVGIGWKF